MCKRPLKFWRNARLKMMGLQRRCIISGVSCFCCFWLDLKIFVGKHLFFSRNDQSCYCWSYNRSWLSCMPKVSYPFDHKTSSMGIPGSVGMSLLANNQVAPCRRTVACFEMSSMWVAFCCRYLFYGVCMYKLNDYTYILYTQSPYFIWYS